MLNALSRELKQARCTRVLFSLSGHQSQGGEAGGGGCVLLFEWT